MKPPPQLLVLLMLWVEVAVSSNVFECSKILPRKNIKFKGLESLKKLKPSGSYINHLEDNIYLLYCYATTPVTTAVVTSPKGDHVVTIKSFPCGYKSSLMKKTYMFLDPSLNSKVEIISIGIFADTLKDWCRYDICISNCGIAWLNRIRPNPDSLPNADYFRWSEKGIPITKQIPQSVGDVRERVVAEYVSIGEPKFVVVCYVDGHVVLRNTVGQHIATMGSRSPVALSERWDVTCSPNTPPNIQTFYILTIEKDKTDFPAVTHDYRLSKKMAEDDFNRYNHRILKYPDITMSDNLMLYYFLTSSSSKTCYWKKINTEIPNACPSLPYDAVSRAPSISDTMRKESRLAAVARYTAGYTHPEDPILTFTCFKINENERVNYYFVVTVLEENHVVTIKGIDCSSKDNFDGKLFVHTTFGDANPSLVVVGSRWSKEDDWCTYSLGMVTEDLKGSKVTKWVYYGFSPEDKVLSWEEVDLHQCPGLPRENVDVEDVETNVKGLPARYLGLARHTADSILLDCYTVDQNHYINMFKTLKGEAIATINGLDGCFHNAKNQRLFIIKDKIENNNYLVIGDYKWNEWCQLDVCVDCKKKEVKRNFNKIADLSHVIVWSKAGVRQEGGSQSLLSDYNTGNIMQQYIEEFDYRFVLVCIKSEEEGELKWVLRKTTGTLIGTINVGSDWQHASYFRLEPYLLTISSNGEVNLCAYGDSADRCEVPSDSDSETWFYSVSYRGYTLVKETNLDNPNSCEALKKENILMKKPDFLEGGEVKYRNGGNPRFTIICNHETKSYAVINAMGKHVLTLQDFDCHDERAVQQLYIHTTSGDEDVSQVVVGSQDPKTRQSCYYNVVFDEEGGYIWDYYGYKPDELARQWYAQASAEHKSGGFIIIPVKPDEGNKEAEDPTRNINTNRESKEDNQDRGKLLETFISTNPEHTKILYCYENSDLASVTRFTSVMKSATGNLELTVKGLDCSKLSRFYMSYMKNTKKNILVLWTRNSEVWCRYDICLDCKMPEVQFNIDKDPGDTKRNTEILAWAEPETTITEAMYIGVAVYVNDVMNEIQEQYKLHAKFITNDDLKFQLHCFVKLYKDSKVFSVPHFAVITNANGQHLVTINFNDYLLEDYNPNTIFDVIIYKTVGDAKLIILGIKYTDKQTRLNFNNYYVICWNCETSFITRIDKSDYQIEEKKRQIWEKVVLDDCPSLKRKDLYIEENKYLLDESKLVISYSNNGAEIGGMWYLRCYSTGDDSKYVSVLRSIEGSHLMSFKGIDCSSNTLLKEASFMSIKKTEKEQVVHLATRIVHEELRGSWCQYDIRIAGETDVKSTYNLISEQDSLSWSEEESENCRAVNSENVFTDENEKSLAGKNFDSMYIMGAFENNSGSRGKRTDLFYIYCYYMEDDIGKRKYTLVIKSTEGSHLATISDLDFNLRTDFGLENKIYMFSMTEHGSPSYLAFVSRTNSGDVKWCQYIICLNSKTTEVRRNKITLDSRDKHFLWEKTESESCLMVKSENILTNENEKKLDDLILESGFEMAVININGPELEVKEVFLIFCYYEEVPVGNRIYTMVIRTAEGRHLATVREYCSPKEALGFLQEKTYMFTMTLSGHDYLALGTRTSTAEKWCRYDICINCNEPVVHRNIHVDRQERMFRWKPAMQFKRPIASKDISKVVVQENWNNDMELVAKYESGGFRLDCYQDFSSNNYNYISVVTDRNGEHFAKIPEFKCSSVKELYDKIKLIFYKNVDNEDDVTLVYIRQFADKTCCKYDECDICEEKLNQLLGFKTEWIKVPLETCNSLPQENILTVSSEVDLKDYKVLATYLIENHKYKEDTFVLVCYQNYVLKEDNRYITQVQTLGHEHVVSIRNLDCSSARTLSRVSYMSITTAEGKRYLVLGTRSTRGEENGDWCQYDICIDCAGREIRVNANDDPESVETFKWSTVTNPRKSSMNLDAGFLNSKEEEGCLPKSKKMQDLEKPEISPVILKERTEVSKS